MPLFHRMSLRAEINAQTDADHPPMRFSLVTQRHRFTPAGPPAPAGRASRVVAPSGGPE